MALVAAGCVAGCRGQSAATVTANEEDMQVTNSHELKTYEGTTLTPLSRFRENSIKGPQKVDIESYRLKIEGLVDTPRTYTYSEVTTGFTPHKRVITMKCVEGWDVTVLYEGPLVRDLIAAAGAAPEAKIVIFRSVDGYSTSFPLSYVMDNPIILACKMNGITIPPERGFPFHLAAQGKWGYKWAKWVSGIELSADTAYRGFWEQRGYSGSGDENAPMFESQAGGEKK